MEDALKEALEIVRAQARLRHMTEEEIVSMTRSLTRDLSRILGENSNQAQEPAVTPANHIRERSITCLECGKSFRTITLKHLRAHGLTKRQYLAKWGLPKGTSLTCKSLARERRKRMSELQVWKYRELQDQPKS